jgi:ankyrin repeat protein
MSSSSVVAGGGHSEEDINRAQRAQKFYTDSVKLLVGNKPDDEKSFLSLLESYLHTKNNSMVSLQQTFQEYQSEGKTLLHIASSTGKLQAAEGIISKCPDVSQIVNLQDKNEYTPIINATICESLPLMQLLIDNGANVKLTNKDGASALNFAAADGSIERMDLLLANGADVNNTSEAGTPIGWASGKGQTKAVRYLIEHNGDVNRTGSAQLVPPVFLAAVANCDETTALLVESGADVGALITGNLTLLHICAESGLTAAVAAIIKTETGQKTACVVNTDGSLPIHMAAMSKHVDCIKLLLPFSGPPYSTMEPDAHSTMETILKEGADHLAAWHAQSEKKTQNSSSPTVESSESTAPQTPPIPDLTQLNITEADKAKGTEWKDKGNAFYKKKDFKSAIEAYSKGLEMDPTNHVIYSNRSACFHALEDYDSCLKDAEICRRLVPQWIKGCYRLATARFALGKYEDAAVAAYEGLQIDQSNDELKSLLQRAVKKGQQEHKAKTSS